MTTCRQEIAEPIVEKIDFSSLPIVSLAVRSDRLTPREMTDLAEKTVQRRVENVEGVGKVDLVGTSFREVSVEVLPERLQALGLGVDDIIQGLRAENVNVPVGRLNRGGAENSVRVSGKPARVEDYAQVVVAEVEGRPVTLGDVARVVDGVEEQRTLALVDGGAGRRRRRHQAERRQHRGRGRRGARGSRGAAARACPRAPASRSSGTDRSRSASRCATSRRPW